MKLCEKCGAQNSDERMFCVDCAEKLGKVLSPEQEAVYRKTADERMEKMYNNDDPLYVSVLDKIIGGLALVGMAGVLVLWIVEFATHYTYEYLWVSLLAFFGAMITALVPKVLWEVEKLRLSFYLQNADDASPNGFYKLGRKLSEIILIALGVFIIAINLFEFSFLSL